MYGLQYTGRGKVFFYNLTDIGKRRAIVPPLSTTHKSQTNPKRITKKDGIL